VALTHFLADRFRANPKLGVWLERLAGACLLGFGLKLAISK
jgi:leucine efflux protein